jgi:HEAT repeat protein
MFQCKQCGTGIAFVRRLSSNLCESCDAKVKEETELSTIQQLITDALGSTAFDPTIKLGEALRKFKVRNAIEALAVLLKDEDAYKRGIAAGALRFLVDDRAFEYLTAAIKDESSAVRLYATKAMALQKNHRAVQYLIESLKDDEPQVRSTAANGFIHQVAYIHDSENTLGADARRYLSSIADALIFSLRNDVDSSVRLNSADALGMLRTPSTHHVTQALYEALKDSNQHVRTRAADSLKRYKGILQG